MNYTETRINKLRNYLFGVINDLAQDDRYQINADFLGEIGDYSLDKIPVETKAGKWIIGSVRKKEVFSFRSRKAYSQDAINNLKNIGFFEEFAEKIEYNNDHGVLPDINGIESIECLNPGTLNDVSGTQAIFDIQIQIIYRDNKEEQVSL